MNLENKRSRGRKDEQARTCVGVNTRENATQMLSVLLLVLCGVIPAMLVRSRSQVIDSQRPTGATEIKRVQSTLWREE